VAERLPAGGRRDQRPGVSLIQIRGFIALAAVVAAIAWFWEWSENRQSDPAAVTLTTTTTTTTTSTVAPPTTTTPEQARQAMCRRSQRFADEAAVIPEDHGPGTLADLAIDYYADLRQIVATEIDAEIVSVIAHYRDFITTGEPYGYSVTDIILRGDKEKYEQLVTRPFPGLQAVRDHIVEQCSVETPDQYRVGARWFNDLEDRLLGTS